MDNETFVTMPSRSENLRVELPQGSCDAHCHVFGPIDRFPYSVSRTFTPAHEAPKESVFELHKMIGIDRGVVVQSGCYGTDHSVLIDLLVAGEGKYKGVALSSAETTREDIARLNSFGVCGMRVSFLPHLGPNPSEEYVRALEKLIKPYGWHLSFHVAGDGILNVARLIRSLTVPVVIDHMGRIDISKGVDIEPVQCLLDLMVEGVWVKLSGSDRLSTDESYRDGAGLAHLLANHDPNRVVWGTDYPHPNIVGSVPDDVRLVNLIGSIAPSDIGRKKLLIDNPSVLFGW